MPLTHTADLQQTPAGPCGILHYNIKYESGFCQAKGAHFSYSMEMLYEIESVCKSNVLRAHATIETGLHHISSV